MAFKSIGSQFNELEEAIIDPRHRMSPKAKCLPEHPFSQVFRHQIYYHHRHLLVEEMNIKSQANMTN